jgi:hypothetical protein
VVKIGLDPGNARDETVDFVLAKAGVFEGEFRGFDVKLGGAEMRDDADLGIGCADDRDLVLQRCRGNSSVHRELCSKRHRAQDVTIQNLALFYRFGHSRRSKAVLTERTRPSNISIVGNLFGLKPDLTLAFANSSALVRICIADSNGNAGSLVDIMIGDD